MTRFTLTARSDHAIRRTLALTKGKAGNGMEAVVESHRFVEVFHNAAELFLGIGQLLQALYQFSTLFLYIQLTHFQLQIPGALLLG
jgi:hypothetical protein